MSQSALFGFGSVIFFIVMTGAFLYGMAVIGEIFDNDNKQPPQLKVKSHYSLDDEWWQAIK